VRRYGSPAVSSQCGRGEAGPGRACCRLRPVASLASPARKPVRANLLSARLWWSYLRGADAGVLAPGLLHPRGAAGASTAPRDWASRLQAESTQDSAGNGITRRDRLARRHTTAHENGRAQRERPFEPSSLQAWRGYLSTLKNENQSREFRSHFPEQPFPGTAFSARVARMSAFSQPVSMLHS